MLQKQASDITALKSYFLTPRTLFAAALFCMGKYGWATPTIPASMPIIPAFSTATSFVGTGTLTGALLGPGPNGSQRLYTTYAYGTNLELVAFDPVHGTHQSWTAPYAASNTMIFGTDGDLYLGTYRGCHVLRLDPKTNILQDLGEAVPGELGIWQISFGPDGNLYGGTNLGGKLFQLAPRSGKFTDYGRMAPPQRNVRTVCAAPDGWVYCGIGTAQADIVGFNPKTGERRDLLTAAERQHGTALVVRAADGGAYGIFHGKFYRLKDGAATNVATPPRPAPQTQLPENVEAKLLKDYHGRSLPVYNMVTGPDGKVYGSGYKTEQLFRYDPADGKATTVGILPGMEAYAFLSVGSKLYIASYPHATLQVYDPAKPYRIGTEPNSNPRNYGTVAPHQDRPFSMTLGSDGNIYVACTNATGGALAWFDPRTGRTQSMPTPQAGHGLMSVCALPGGLIACGLSGRNPDRSYADANLLLWDPARQQVVFSTPPVAGAHEVRDLTLGKDGLLYGTAWRSIFVFDPVSRRVLATVIPPQGRLAVRGALQRLSDGRLVALAGDTALFVSYAHGQFQLTSFARHTQRLLIGQAAVGDHLYAVDETEQGIIRCLIPPAASEVRKVSSLHTAKKSTRHTH